MTAKKKSAKKKKPVAPRPIKLVEEKPAEPVYEQPETPRPWYRRLKEWFIDWTVS